MRSTIIAGLLLAFCAAHSPAYAGDREVGDRLPVAAFCVEASPVFEEALAAVEAALEADDIDAYIAAMAEHLGACADVRLNGWWAPVNVEVVALLEWREYSWGCMQYLRVRNSVGALAVTWTACGGQES